MRSLVLALALVPVLQGWAMAGSAEAQTNRFAMVAITNDTDQVLNYQFRWGDGSWGSFSVAPGEVRWHSWTYDYVNQNHSPVPSIRFDYDMSGGFTYREYQLIAYASPWQDATYAKQYSFQTFYYGAYLDLYSRN